MGRDDILARAELLEANNVKLPRHHVIQQLLDNDVLQQRQGAGLLKLVIKLHAPVVSYNAVITVSANIRFRPQQMHEILPPIFSRHGVSVFFDRAAG